MKTLPKKWFIKVTDENKKELTKWVHSREDLKESFKEQNVGGYVTSNSRYDKSYQSWCVGNLSTMREFKNHTEITIEQFRQITNPVSETVTIPKSLVLQAHKEACSDWKKRIEEVVPELFVKPIPNEIQSLIDKYGKEKLMEYCTN